VIFEKFDRQLIYPFTVKSENCVKESVEIRPYLLAFHMVHGLNDCEGSQERISLLEGT
jgi:hypothetical protein